MFPEYTWLDNRQEMELMVEMQSARKPEEEDEK